MNSDVLDSDVQTPNWKWGTSLHAGMRYMKKPFTHHEATWMRTTGTVFRFFRFDIFARKFFLIR